MGLISFFQCSFIYYVVLFGNRVSKCDPAGEKRPDPELLELTTLNEEGLLEVNVSKNYEVEKTGLFKSTVNYVFKEGSNCVRVKYDGKTLWSHNSEVEGGNYPKHVEFNPSVNTTYVVFDTFRFWTFHFQKGKWEFSRPATLGYPSHYKPVLEEPVEEQEETKELVSEEQGEEQAEQVEEAAEAGEEGESAERLEQPELSDDSTARLTDYYSEESSRPSTPATEEPKETIELPVYKVVTLDDEGNLVENDVESYDLKRKDKVVTKLLYKFKEGSKCVEFKKGDETIWKREDFHRGEYPKSIFYNSHSRRLLVNFHD